MAAKFIGEKYSLANEYQGRFSRIKIEQIWNQKFIYFIYFIVITWKFEREERYNWFFKYLYKC